MGLFHRDSQKDRILGTTSKMEEQIFLDLMNKSMLASVRQVRLSLGRPSSHATREEALQQVAMLKAAKESAHLTGK